MAKEGSKLGKEIESLKKRLQASKKHLKQSELKAENLNALIEAARQTRARSTPAQNLSEKAHPPDD
jgi:hypothetical protein